MGNLVAVIALILLTSTIAFVAGVLLSDKVKRLVAGDRCAAAMKYLHTDRLRSWGRCIVALMAKTASRCADAAGQSAAAEWLMNVARRNVNGPRTDTESHSHASADTETQMQQEEPPPDDDECQCRVRLATQVDQDAEVAIFSVELRGNIEVPSEGGEALLHVAISDITDNFIDGSPVYARGEQYHMTRPTPFCCTTPLGHLPGGRTTLSDWTVVTRLRCDRLWLPRRGDRKLMFTCTVILDGADRELTSAENVCLYDNPDMGYLDFEQNCRRATNLGVGLAFAVSASDGKLFNCEIDLIKEWARSHVRLADDSNKAQRELEKQLNKTVAFFRKGNRLNIEQVCREIVTIAPLSERQDIMELCLRVAQAKGMAAPEELAILKDLANWLEVPADRFRAMMEKILPIGIHAVQDSRTILGITEDMSPDDVLAHLTAEYGKWNARVTNPSPEVRKQADQMLKLIAEVRRQYTGETVTI